MGNIKSSWGADEPESILPAADRVKAAQKKYLDQIQGCNGEDDVGASGNLGGSKLELDEVDTKAQIVDPKDYVFPFENLVFEGGGSKGLAFCGAVEVLEELDIVPQIKRFAGSSAGAIGAALLAVGFTSSEVREFLRKDLSQLLQDHKFGYLSLLPNLVNGFGWNPGERFNDWLRDVFEKKTGIGNITFQQVLDMYGKELCIVVTNLNQKCTEYLHPKTTPDMSVPLAVRTSMSLPGIFQAMRITVNEEEDLYIDGGILCNFPIHCFDGWWLSLKDEDSFIDRLQPLKDLPRLFEKKERFGEYNDKTIGFLLYGDEQQDLMRHQLEKRVGTELPPLPKTKLAKQKRKRWRKQKRAAREHGHVVTAWDAFLKALKRHNVVGDTISRHELQDALSDESMFTESCRRCIFGDVDNDTILEYLDRDGNGQISFTELKWAMSETGVKLRTHFMGYERTPVTNLSSFFATLQDTIMTNIMRMYMEERDVLRTVGINTGHVGTTDFQLEDEDVSFLTQQGRRSTLAFLKYYVAQNDPPRKV